tara:strand:- start:199 stop:1125 length:927 start_codon:yes stop_codon:yes gene_type:complete
MGNQAISQNTTGSSNTAFGAAALYANTTAANNTAVGKSALTANTTGTQNVAIGANAGDSTTTADDTVAIGYLAGRGNTTGKRNVAIGRSALQLANNTSSADVYNVAVGALAGLNVGSGTRNTLIGGRAGDTITSGSSNVIVGYNCDVATGGVGNSIVMGEAVSAVGGNNFTFGNGTLDSNIAFGATSITAPSDERFKEEIQTSTAGLSFINDLRPVTYKWKKEKDLPATMDAYVEGSENRAMNDNINHGFIAQEVKAAIDNHSEIKDGFDMWMEKESDGQQRIAPSALVPMLVKAIQELTARITTLEG